MLDNVHWAAHNVRVTWIGFLSQKLLALAERGAVMQNGVKRLTLSGGSELNAQNMCKNEDRRK